MLGTIKQTESGYEIKVTGVAKDGRIRTRFINGKSRERLLAKAYLWLQEI